jgi:hypothetical protein
MADELEEGQGCGGSVCENRVRCVGSMETRDEFQTWCTMREPEQERTGVRSSFFGQIRGSEEDLIVSGCEGFVLRPYDVYLRCMGYGVEMHVCQFVVTEVCVEILRCVKTNILSLIGERANGLEMELSGRALQSVEKVGNAGNNVRVES